MIWKRVLWAGLTLALTLGAVFAAVAPPERCPSVSEDELRRSAQATVDWFVRNQDSDGTWLYEYDAANDSIVAGYNEVRHAGVTMGLYQAAAAELPRALRSADRGTEWALDELVEREDWSAIEGAGRVTTGATALFAAGLTIRREATGDTRYDPLLRRLGNFLLGQTEPSGAVLAEYDPDREAPVPGEYSKYYTGEAYWALARLHRAFPDEGWEEGADRIGAYLAESRDDVEGHWPPIPDHWAAYGAAETAEFPERAGDRPLTEDEVDYAREQAGLMGVGVRWVSQQFGPWGELVRGGDTPRGGGYGVMSEALTGWWLTAVADSRLAGMREATAERASCVAGLTLEEQYDAGGGCGLRPAGAGRGRLACRRRNADGRPAARARRDSPDDSDRPGERDELVRRGRRRAVRAAVGSRAGARAQPDPRPPSRSRVPGGRAAKPWSWPSRAVRSEPSSSACSRPWRTRSWMRSTSAIRRSASGPGSSPGWPARSTSSGHRRRPSPHSQAAAPRWYRSRSRPWPGRPCSWWRSAPAPTRACS